MTGTELGPGGGGWKDTKVVSFHISASRAHKVSSETITQTDDYIV